MGNTGNLRMLAVVMALTSAALHLALYLQDLIPGQPTAGGLPFLAMTVLYAGVAAVAWLGVQRLYFWAAAYTALTIVGYFATRIAMSFPVEVWGLTDKAVEVVLIASLVGLMRQSSTRALAHPQTGG